MIPTDNNNERHWIIEESNVLTSSDDSSIWSYKFYLRLKDGTYLSSIIQTRERLTFNRVTIDSNPTDHVN